ncbi:MAG: site-specific DNA-methyltransferase, partial [Erysipelotrichaceae bacterium]|nr:site-specific DNA-methyltransferase [Erysipelotrichaceae bacterium]
MKDKEILIKKIESLKQGANEDTASVFNEIIEQLKKNTYGLSWSEEGRKERVVEECERDLPVLRLDQSKTIDNGGLNNILIEGDNYHSLKALNLLNKESVDVIYIDPPYNAKNYTFMYRDSFVNYDGTRHDRWLSFMDKRLRLAHSLLKEDGVMFISIDESELANLKLLCNQIFAEENFLVTMVIMNSLTGTQSSADFAQQHSYCLAYRKSDKFRVNRISLSEKQIKEKYKYGEDEKGPYYVERLWKRGAGGLKEVVPTMHFPVWYNENTNEILIDEEIKGRDENDYTKILPYQSKDVLGRWNWSKEKMKADRDQLIMIKAANKWKLYKKVYAVNEAGKKPQSLIDSGLGRTELGTKELNNIMGGKSFEYPKYSLFIKYLISLHQNKDAVVMDFFAGSGTTGQAVLDLNHEDGGRRRFILCTNNENGICEKVTYPRIKTVITGKRSDGSSFSEGR